MCLRNCRRCDGCPDPKCSECKDAEGGCFNCQADFKCCENCAHFVNDSDCQMRDAGFFPTPDEVNLLTECEHFTLRTVYMVRQSTKDWKILNQASGIHSFVDAMATADKWKTVDVRVLIFENGKARYIY